MSEPDPDDTEGSTSDDATAPADHDPELAWREIVENYGDRAVLEPEAYTDPPLAPEPSRWVDDDEPDDDLFEDEERFVPPTPPPVGHTSAPRTLAWLGMLGSPVVLLVALVTGLPLPTVVGWLLVAAFVGGFGYLVATMPREPRDPWDDGSRV